MRAFIFLIAVVYCIANCTAFVSSSRHSGSSIRLQAETQDRNKGYGPFGSLTRQGPVPFFIRLSQPDTYEAAVNKYMLLEKCDRMTAQGRSL